MDNRNILYEYNYFQCLIQPTIRTRMYITPALGGKWVL